MRHQILFSVAVFLFVTAAFAADEKAAPKSGEKASGEKAVGDKPAAKPGEAADNTGFDRPEFKQPLKSAAGDAKGKPSTKSDKIAKILAGLEPKEAPAKLMPPMQPEDPAARILAIFQQLDQDGSGTISRGEFRVLLEQAGPENTERLQGLFRYLDANRDDRISAQEVRQGVGRRGDGNGNGGNGNNNNEGQVNPAIVQLTQATLARLDRNGDGRISEREARNDPQVQAAFVLGDTNQDKELSGEEIYGLLARQAAQANPGKDGKK